MSSEGLTDAECEGGWHVTQAFYTGLVFSEPAVARIKADTIATARAEERERVLMLVLRTFPYCSGCFDVDHPCGAELCNVRIAIREAFAQPAETKAADQ